MGIAGEYSKAVLKHWKAVVLSLTALVAIVNNWNKFQQWLHLPWWAWLAIILASINVAQFLAWKELRQRHADAVKTYFASFKTLAEGNLQNAEIVLRQKEKIKTLTDQLGAISKT